MNFIITLNQDDLGSMISNGSESVYLSLPGVNKHIARVLIECSKRAKVSVVIDNSEAVIRNGYGEVESIELMREAGVDIRELEGNLVSFIIVDSYGYLIFPQSKIFFNEPNGPNAIKIDPFTIRLLIQNYFPAEDSKSMVESQDELLKKSIQFINVAIKEQEFTGPTVETKALNLQRFDSIKSNIEINPPLKPDLQRQINTYTAKIQFVEFKFSGGNLANHIASLPNDAIPINSNELKNLLNTRIKMFQDAKANEEYKIFESFKEKVDALRKQYLKAITCRQGKSVILLMQKEKFKSDLKELQLEASSLNDMLREMLEKERFKTEDLVRNELTAFFNKNEPEEISRTIDTDLKKRKLDDLITKTVSSIKFPNVDKLLDNISLSALYFDLTYSDFSDDNLIKEFQKKGIMSAEDIDSIVTMKKVFEANQ